MADERSRAAIERQVLALLRNHGQRAFRPKEIAKTLDVSDHARYRLFREVLAELVEGGQVARADGGRVQHKAARPRHEAEGVLAVNPAGFGFVRVEGFEADLYVPQHRLSTALDGDRVRVEIAAPTRGADGERREAEVTAVLERGRTETVGTFERLGRAGWVKPDDRKLTHDVYVAPDDWNGAETGLKVVVSLDRFDDPKAAPEGRVLRVLGPADESRVAVLALAMAHGVRSDFPPEAEREAEAIPVEIPQDEIARRLDLRPARVFTIDPVDAKDFDDAVHVRALEDGSHEVGVHIADVSHYVAEGTPLDAEAFERGTSTYLVDRVIPMLPEKLSNGVCSLRPHEDKLTFSVLMEVSPKGVVKRYEIRETVIHSQARFAYEEAQEIIDGGLPDHPFRADVLRANALARVLTRKRLKEGSIDFDTSEIRVVLDAEGAPVEIVKKARMEANRLIEELMLLANRTVAEEVGRRQGRPFVYRIHDRPDEERMRQLGEYVRPFGYKLPMVEGVVARESLNALLAHFKGTPEAAVIETAAIQAMAKAVYSPDNIGHYGLGFEHYSHFTSPIRRYPDLIAHRLLKRYARPPAKGGGAPANADALRSACRHLSDRERDAAEAERESVRMKQVEFVARHLGEEFDGVVVGVTKFGVFVELTALLTQGLVHVREMGDDYWEYDPRRYALVGSRSGRAITHGDPARVRVVAADPGTRRIDLRFVDARDEREAQKPARKGERKPAAKAASKSATKPGRRR